MATKTVTDASFGQDVLANIIWACQLSISIGLVSTGIATLIGVTMGAIMGYFGGWVDLVLFRVVEVFMAVPVLFLLIVAAAVLPPEMRSTYVMMAIIGCFTWTSAARYTRAECFGRDIEAHRRWLARPGSEDVVVSRAGGEPIAMVALRPGADSTTFANENDFRDQGLETIRVPARIYRSGKWSIAVIVPESYGSMPNSARATSDRPAPTSPARPTTSPARTSNETS